MSLIEGIGDEVTKFFLLLLITIIGALAWWSTGLAHRPLIRTVLIFEHRTRTQSPPIISPSQNNSTDSREENNEMSTGTQNVRIDNNSTSSQECERNNCNASSDENAVRSICEEQANINVQTERSSEEDEHNNIVEIMDSDSNVIRRRRLAFFQNQSEPHNSNIKSEGNLCKNEENTNINKCSKDSSETANKPQESSKQNVNNIRIKLKYLNDDLKLVQGSLQEQLGEFKRRHFEVELAASKLVRLIFNGQVLREDSETLERCGLFDNCVVHCLVHQAPASATVSSTNEILNTNSNIQSENVSPMHRHSRTQRDNDSLHWNLGNLLFVLITFILTTVWYFRYEYAHLFTVTATVGLVCLTGIFTLLTIGLFFPVTSIHSDVGNTRTDHTVETVATTII